jgi:hypothetical protein
MIMNKKLLSILALLCLTVTSAWATNYTSFSGGEVLKPGDTFSVPSGDGSWEINGMVFQSSRSPFIVLRADVFPGENPGDPATVTEDENGMCYVIKDNADSYYFTDWDKMNILFAQDNSTYPPTTYDGIAVTKTDATHYTFAGHELPAATSGYCGDPSDNDGKNVTWEVSGTTITIRGNGAMANFDIPQMGYGTPAPWLASYADKITSIVIEEGVTTVGDYAFEDCKIVESISIPASVTSIGTMAFEDCGYTDDYTFTNLTVTIASGSNLETIGNSAFEYCQMTSFSIPNGVKTIGEGAFSYCFGLTSIEMPASVTSIGWNAFYLCKNLATLTLNSNPFIDAAAFSYAGEATAEFNQGSTTVTMNLTATVGDNGEYWMTFYNQNHNFLVPATGTQIFKGALSGSSLPLTELTTDKVVAKNNAVILKSATASISLTRTTGGGSNDYTGNDLQGVEAAAGATSDGTFYVLNDGTQGVGFYPVASGTKIGVGNAYVTSTSSSDFLSFNPPAIYNVTFADGLTGWTADPTSTTEGETITLNYTGTKKVKRITITKKEATVTTAPTATTDDIMGGSTTELVTAGTAEGGTMMYKVTTENTKPTTTDGFSATVPTAETLAAGTYYVWYYVKADDANADSEIAGPITVTVKSYTMAAAATDADKGKLICAAGHIHAYGKDAACTNARMAKIIYVGSSTDNTTYTHGLALALSDESEAAWDAAKTACSDKNTSAPVTGASWMLPSINQWTTMVNAAGGRDNLRTGFSSVGGTDLVNTSYWSSTADGTNKANRYGFNNGSTASVKQTMELKVRACLAF